jgi:hypothetical protein
MITPYECLLYGGVGRDFPQRDFCQLIPQIEQELARECVGKDLWAYLKTKLNTTPTGATDWLPSAIYDEDDVVIRDGCTFTSLVDSNTSDPLVNSANWQLYEKFTDDYCNELWTGYLRRLLAMKVCLSSITAATFRVGSGGLVVNTGDSTGARTGKKEEINDVKTAMIAEIERVMKNMLEWLADNYITAGMPAPLGCGNCETRGGRRRRWNFRNETGEYAGGTVIIGGTTTPTGDTFGNLREFDSDAEAIANGLQIGQFYRIKTTAGNPYGLKAGTTVKVEAL